MVSVTGVPSVGLLGAVLPVARRTMISARSVSAGLVQDSEMEVAVRAVTVSPVTGPGAVMSKWTATGIERDVVVLSPSCHVEFLPQHCIVSPVKAAHVCSPN